MLGLTSSLINGTCEITQFIQQLSMEILKYGDALNERSMQERSLLKHKIISSKFNKRTLIDWKFVKNESNIGFSIIKGGLNNDTIMRTEEKNSEDVKFYLTISNIVLCGVREGYIFKVERISSLNEEEDINSSFMMDKQNTELLDKTNKLNVDKNYIPNSDANFNIDIQSMSYNIFQNNRINNELKKEIKQKAIDYLKQPEEEKEIQEEAESQDSQTSKDESEVTDSDVTDEDSVRENIVNNSVLSEYYKVKLSDIKFLIWNPYQNQITEVQSWSKQSNVELKKNFSNEADFYEPRLNNSYKSNNKKLTNTPENVNIQEEETNEKELMAKQLEYSLKKEEKQTTITRLKWLSFSSCTFVFGLAVAFLVCFIMTFATIKENVVIIFNSHQMIYDSIDGTYYMQELILLKNPNYTNTFRPPSEQINNTLTKLYQIYNSSHDNQIYIIKSFLPLSTKASNFTIGYTFNVNIITDTLKIDNYKLTVSSAFLGVSSAVFKVVKDPTENVIPTNKNVYYYLYNSLNGLLNGLYLQAEVYLNELEFNTEASVMILLYLVIIACCGLIFCYFILIWAFTGVTRRKESYLQVFFEIPQSVIKRCLDKCENFAKQLQSDMLSDDLSILMDKEEENSGQPNKTLQVNKSKKKNIKKTSGSLKSKLFLIVGLLIFAFYFIITFFFYQYYLQNLKYQLHAYKDNILSRIDHKRLFVVLRAYMFDTNALTNGMKAEIHFDQLIMKAHNISHNQNYAAANNMVYYSGEYKKLTDSVINNDLCNLTSLNNCSVFLANSAANGLEVALANYIEEVRELKFDFMLLMANRNKSFVYNNTLYGTSLARNFTPTQDLLEQYQRQDPFRIFNRNSHRDISVLYESLLSPVFNYLNTLQMDYINHEYNKMLTIYVIVYSLFLSMLVLCFLFIWKPFEIKLNRTIYKTKNMLSIIPKEILASLESINRLLDIGKGRKKQIKHSAD